MSIQKPERTCTTAWTCTMSTKWNVYQEDSRALDNGTSVERKFLQALTKELEIHCFLFVEKEQQGLAP